MGAYALSSAAQAGDWLINLDDTVVALIYAFVARMIFTFWVIGVALGSLFYVVPRATFNALASGGMAFASWILWAGLSGVSALGALVDPSVPYVVTSIGNAGTILLLAPILLAVATLAMTISGRWSLTLGAGTLAFALLIDDLLAVDARCSRRSARLRQRAAHGPRHGMGDWTDHPGHPRGRHLRPLRLSPITRLRACCAAIGATPS